MKINVGSVKEVTKVVTSGCASVVAGTIIGNICPAANLPMKVVVMIGGGAIGGMIGDKAGEYMSDVVGDCCESINGCIIE